MRGEWLNRKLVSVHILFTQFTLNFQQFPHYFSLFLRLLNALFFETHIHTSKRKPAPSVVVHILFTQFTLNFQQFPHYFSLFLRLLNALFVETHIHTSKQKPAPSVVVEDKQVHPNTFI